MGTALSVPSTERKLGIMNTGKVDIKKARASLAARGSSVRLFPGDALNFKKGMWYFGFGKKDGPYMRTRVKSGSQFVMNLANAVETWQTFVDSKPKFAPLAYLINGESRAPREEMGQLDEANWDAGDDGQLMDPVQAITVCPIRAPRGTELHHITLSSVSSRIAFEQLLGQWLDQYDDNEGKLPIVELVEAEERTRKGSKQTYLVPAFKIVGWETAGKIDNPGKGGIEVAQPEDNAPDTDEDDDAEAEATRRAAAKAKAIAAAAAEEEVEEAPRSRKATASAAPAAKLAKTRGNIREEEAEEEAEEPEHDPRKGNWRGLVSRKAKTFEEVEAEEPEEDRPTVRSRTAVAGVPKAPAKKAAPVVEEAEEEVEEVRPRKRLAALH